MQHTERFFDCFADLDNGVLTIGNDCIRRTWDMTSRLPLSGTLTDVKSGRQWLSPVGAGQWECWPEEIYAFYLRGVTTGAMEVLGLEARIDDDYGVGEHHLEATVRMRFESCDLDWVHVVYPGLPVLRSFLRIRDWRGAKVEAWPEEWPDDYLERLALDLSHGTWEAVSFYDQTDDNDDLVEKRGGILTRRQSRLLRANLLHARDLMSQAGILMVKEGPSCVGTLSGQTGDFLTKGMELMTMGWGFDPTLLRQGESMESYGSAVMVFDGDESAMLRVLHDYNRAIRPFRADRDAQIMSNTWGGGNADGRICEAFLMDELRRASELGITWYQIDDGWERGITANSRDAEPGAAWGEGYYTQDPEFWSVDPVNLPNGLEPLVDYANDHGIRLGLWFSPDSLNDFEHWERDADLLLSLHRRYGISAFKMDGLIYRTKRGEENFVRLMRKVVAESKGKVLFNLDTTASVRNGYFGRVQYGNLFLENRFTKPFGRWPNYWPHHTLRNLWMLSKYLPTERLQVEFLNVKNDSENYGGDPLAPEVWGQELAFAIAMFASPLAWMELSDLDEDAVVTLREAFHRYRSVQAQILGGHVLPIGEEPDGIGWTGLQSVTGEGTGYLLLIRQAAGEGNCEFPLWGLRDCMLELEPILGTGEQSMVQVTPDGIASFCLDEPFRYALYRYRGLTGGV